MCDEDDFDVFIAGEKKSIEKKKETSRQIFFHRVHGAGSVHNAEHNGVGLPAGFRHGMMIPEVILVKRKPLAVQTGDVRSLRGFLPFDSGARRAFFVETNTDALFSKSLVTKLSLHFHLTQVFPIQVREL